MQEVQTGNSEVKQIVGATTIILKNNKLEVNGALISYHTRL